MQKQLAQLVKEKYGTEVYCIDKLPSSGQPFYTMINSFDDKFSNSYDIVIRGEKVCDIFSCMTYSLCYIFQVSKIYQSCSCCSL